jgi:predicted transcriptional regulator
MELKEYLDECGMPMSELARRAGITHTTVYSIVKGRDIRLSVALQIEDATKGKVTPRELAPNAYISKRKVNSQSNKKK